MRFEYLSRKAVITVLDKSIEQLKELCAKNIDNEKLCLNISFAIRVVEIEKVSMLRLPVRLCDSKGEDLNYCEGCMTNGENFHFDEAGKFVNRCKGCLLDSYKEEDDE